MNISNIISIVENLKNLNALNSKYHPIVKKILQNRSLRYSVGIGPGSELKHVRMLQDFVQKVEAFECGAVVVLDDDTVTVIADGDNKYITGNGYVRQLTLSYNKFKETDEVKFAGKRVPFKDVIKGKAGVAVLVGIDKEMRDKMINRMK